MLAKHMRMTHTVFTVAVGGRKETGTMATKTKSVSAFAIEVFDCGKWIECVDDDKPARFETHEDAACEAQWSIDSDTAWRVVEVSQ